MTARLLPLLLAAGCLDVDVEQLLDDVTNTRRGRRAAERTVEMYARRRAEEPMYVELWRSAVDLRWVHSGAQDYVVKPFATEELLARIEVHLRDRAGGRRLVQLADRVVDLGRNEVRRGDTLLDTLTTREAELLGWLVDCSGRVVERDDLLREVWGHRGASVTRTVDNTILRLRAKIEADPARPRHVLTVHGRGYRFEP